VYLPNDRTVHQSPLPDVGGLAMFAGFLAAMLTAWLVDAFDVLFTNNSEPLGIVIAATIVFGVGFLDDVREVSAPAKVAGTVLAGIVLVQFGVVMFSFRLPFYDGPIVLADLAPLVTVLWLVGMTQAINLIDGLDGLAAGIVAIAAFAFFLYSQELIDRDLLDVRNVGPLLAIIAVGVCVGFLPAQLQPGADHHGRRRRAVPRACCWRCRRASSVAARTRSARSSSARRTSSWRRWSSRC
jgi:UDP-GlcNAc:undecaprenyl-phosphate/decaprenyl-phosphate GlcNAc-1-phosphate transferase